MSEQWVNQSGEQVSNVRDEQPMIDGMETYSAAEVLGYSGDAFVRVVIKAPLQAPYVSLIERGYQSIQKVVEGSFEVVPLFETHMDVYLNEEGLIEGLYPNIKREFNGVPYDALLGTIMVSKVDEEGEMGSLTQAECFQAMNELNTHAFHSPSDIALYFKKIMSGQ